MGAPPSIRATVAVTIVASAACTHIPEKGKTGVGDGYPIEEVVIEGVTAVDHDALVAGLANRPPSGFFVREYYRYEEIQTELDRRRIRSFYERAGYFGVQVEGPTLKRIGDEYDRWRVTWRVIEGKPARVQELVLNGAPPELEDRLRQTSHLVRGEIYDTSKFDTATTRMRALLVRSGYAGASVSGRVQIVRNGGAAAVIFDIDAGPKIRLEGLEVSGPTRTPTSAVRVRKTWEEGDVFDPAELDRFRGRLYTIDHYSGVRLDYEPIDPADPSRARIRATVSEAERNELQIGVGGGFDPANIFLQSRLRYKRRSFPFPLTNTTAEFVPAVQFLREGGDFRDPAFTPQARLSFVTYDFLLPMLRTELDGGYQNQQLEAYQWDGPDLGVAFGRSFFDDRVDLSIGGRLHYYRFEGQRIAGPTDDMSDWVIQPADLYPGNLSPQEVIGVAKPQWVLAIQPAVTYDGRDDVLEPTRGWFFRTQLDLGIATGEQAASFTLLHPEVRAYLPLFGSRLVIAGRVNFATNLSGQLPGARRLYAGGASSQRGFPQRRLSPSAFLLDADDGSRVVGDDGEAERIPIGGETLFETNLEARLRLFKLFGFWFGTVVFVDGADIGVTVSDLEVPNLHYAAGAGLRYLTPIGAVRFDWGIRLNRTGAGEPYRCAGRNRSCYAFHFSLGQAY